MPRPTADRWVSGALNGGRTWSLDRDCSAAQETASRCRTGHIVEHNQSSIDTKLDWIE